jgi:CSLREA domain-containing protein
MNTRSFDHAQPLEPRSSMKRRVLGAALTCLSLLLVLFLGSAQTTTAQDPGQDCYSMIMYPGAMPNSTMGAGYSQVIEIQKKWDCCYTYPIVLTVSRGTLPTGLMLTRATDAYSNVRGVLSGTTVAPGTYSFTIHAKDSGGDNIYYCDGNYNVVVGGVNQAPSFTSGGDVTMVEADHDQPFSVRWATNLSPGGPADTGQTLTFHVSNDNNALFTVQPAITADGVLFFTLKSSVYGAATVSAYVQDNGGTANGGVDRSAAITFQIIVTEFDLPQTGPVFMANSTAWATDGACTINNCTLREAIEAANHYGGNNPSGPASRIELSPGATYAVDGVDNLSQDESPNGLPQITANVTINGHGARIARSDGAPDTRLIDVGGGFLTLNEVTLENGRAGLNIYANRVGGAILVRGKLVVKNSYFVDNDAEYGAAMFNPGGPSAWIYNSTFYGNKSTAGTIYNDGQLTLYNNTFFDNVGVTTSALRAASYTSYFKVNLYNNLFVSSDAGVPLCNIATGQDILVVGGNLATDNSCTGSGVTTLAALKLITLPANNGGLTPNIALQYGSSAIDIGNATACQDANIGSRDQRNYARFMDGNGDHVAACDAGSYEYGSVPLPPPAPGGSPYGPEVSLLLSPPSPDGSHGWYRSPVTVTPDVQETPPVIELRCALDPEVVPTSYDDLPETLCPFLGGAPLSIDGEHAFYAAAMDLWGNKGTVVSATLPIDATPPVIACPAGGPFLLHSGEYTVGPAAVDASVSGLDEASSTLSGTLATGTIGAHTLTFSAADLAGNSASQECPYEVIFDFAGYYPPVEPEPALNNAKAGQTVPLKFSLSGDQGLEIIAAGYPASQAVTCDAQQPTGDLEPAEGPGQSGLSYDSGTGWYQYPWKTGKAWAGTCRALVIQLIDGTEHRAVFKFK